MEKGLNLVFKGMSIQKAAEQAQIPKHKLSEALHELECEHPYCNELHPCRAAKRGTNGVMFCMALTNTVFLFHDCPFYKTKKEFDVEYHRTNRMTLGELRNLGYR